MDTEIEALAKHFKLDTEKLSRAMGSLLAAGEQHGNYGRITGQLSEFDV